jgi:hypothetical protein
MICGSCKASFALVAFLVVHWRQTGCQRKRPVWERVARAHAQGSSGRRILHREYPHLYKTKPMPEDVKAMWKARKATP